VIRGSVPETMQTLLNIGIALALLFVVIVLGMGLWNMLKGGPGNTSQRLMRLRVIGQAIALLLLMGALFFFGGGRG
jgi:Hypoxia induced protein conserved region.